MQPSDPQNQRFSAGFEALLERHIDSLYRFAMSLCRDRSEAEDLCQETALKGLQAYGRFEPGTNFKAWIFAILMNAFRSRYRKRQREKEVPLSELPNPPSVGADVFDLMLGQEVMAEVDKLPAAFREAILMVDLEGLSYREAAQAMDCPQGTLMSRLSRARALLKVQLAAIARERGILSRPLGERNGS